MIVAWNQRVADIAYAEDQFQTFKGVRAMAMMHIAQHDALNAIDRDYESYALWTSRSYTSWTAATAQAAYDVAVSQYPDQQAQLQAELDSWLGQVSDGSSKNRGIQLGHDAAAAILAEREGDGYDNLIGSYTFESPAPGVYQTYPPFGTPPGPGFVFGEGFSHARPFVMTSQSQFRPGSPPSTGSWSYANAYNEVKSKGRIDSTTRTADQTHLAIWWTEFTDGSMNRLARQLTTSRGLNAWRAARMFAQLNMNMFDGYISSFEAKFYYNYWRPWTAMREGNNDGNPYTSADSTWENLIEFTPPFPTYSSAHSTVCATSLTVLGNTFGNSTAFTMTTNVFPAGSGQDTRSFSSFSSAASECGASRVYLGFHFRFDSDAARSAGTNLTNWAKYRYLEPN